MTLALFITAVTLIVFGIAATSRSNTYKELATNFSYHEGRGAKAKFKLKQDEWDAWAALLWIFGGLFWFAGLIRWAILAWVL